MARRERNVPKNGQDVRPAKSTGFRNSPHKHAAFVPNIQEKAPTDNSWGLNIGGDGGNRTRVRKSSPDSSTYLVLPFNLILTTRTHTLRKNELPII